MTRSRHVPLEEAETTVHYGGRARRRAELEERLADALAHGDREIVSQLRDELTGLEDGPDD